MAEINPATLDDNSIANETKKIARSNAKPLVYHDMIAGFGAGFMATAVGFPLDVIKTRLQTSQAKRSALKIGQKIVRKEGVNGLYKGLASPLLTLSVTSSVSFTSFQVLKDVYKAEPGFHLGNYLAGMNCGLVTGVINTTEHHVRTLMQTDKEQRFRNSLHCLTSIVRDHGIRTLFTGWGITTIKDCGYFSTYFFVYEGMKATLQNSSSMLDYVGGPYAAVPIAGGTAGVAGWIVAFPFDCVRAGRQGQSLSDGLTPSSRQVVQDLLETRGIHGLFNGIRPALMRAAMVHSLRFSAYESLLWLFRNMHHEDYSKRSIGSFPTISNAFPGSNNSS